MYGFSFLFACVVGSLSRNQRHAVLPAAYADNWEIICTRLSALVQMLPDLSDFLANCKLPVAVEKCWGWCLHPSDRKALKLCNFSGGPLPVVLKAKSLGADISCCYGISAKTRNTRVRSGGLRLIRLAGLPLAFHHRVAVVRKSVWKHTLHGCQTSCVPKTVYRRLRTKLCRALRVDKAGRSPLLVANALTAEPVDPEWTVLIERFRLCRQLARCLRGNGMRSRLHCFKDIVVGIGGLLGDLSDSCLVSVGHLIRMDGSLTAGAALSMLSRHHGRMLVHFC